MKRRLPTLRVPRLTIRTQIILPFLLLMLILGVIGTFLSTDLVASSLDRRIADQLVNSQNAALDGAVTLQGQLVAGIRLIANTQGVDAAVQAHDVQRLRALIVPLEVNNRLGSVKVFDARGVTILEIDQPDPANPAGLVFQSGTDLSSWPLVKPVLAGSYDALGDKFIGYVGTPATELGAAGPVLSGDTVVGGVLLTTPMGTVLQQMRMKALAHVALYSVDGQLLGSTLTGLPTSLDSATRSFLQLSAPGRASERAVTVHGDPYEWQVTSFYLRQRPQGYLAVALSRQSVLDAGLRSAAEMTTLFAAVVLLLLIIGYLLALRLTRPIDELVATTQAVARGDLTRRLDVNRSDELGALATAFNAMTADLQDRTRALNEQMRRLAALYQAGQGLGQGADPADVARAILALPLRALGIERAVLLSRASEEQPLEVRSAIGLDSASVGRLLQLTGADPGRGLGEDASSAVLTIADPSSDARPAVTGFAAVTGAARVMVVPLVHAGRSTGLLILEVPSVALPEEDVRLLQTVGTEMAVMLENAQLRRTTELQAHRLDQAIVALEKISQALTAVTVGADNLLRAVAHAAADILDVPYASIHLRKETWRARFADVLVGGASARELAAVRASGDEIALRVTRPEQVIDVDLAGDGRGSAGSARKIGLRHAVACAMAQNGEIAGVLVVHMRTPRHLVATELRVLQTLANQAVIALGAAEAYDATRQLATTDSMTGVANYREFQSRLDRELQRARRSREPLAVVMCDLDYFKRINDTVGHPGGDAVLRYLAQEVLIKTVRPKDLVARYGGDEFVLLLRGADARMATAVAERIRAAFSGRPLIYEGQVIRDLSLSLGLANFPRDGETREALVQAADQALYVAKRSGRNRVARRDSGAEALQQAS